MAEITFKPNPFEPEKICLTLPGATIEECLKEFVSIRRDLAPLFLRGKFRVTLNTVEQKDMTARVVPQDKIFIVPSVNGITWAAVGAFLLKAGVAAAISYGLNAAFGKKASAYDDPKSSPTYGFEKAPVMVEGDPIPLHFGRTQAAPAVMSAYLENISAYEFEHVKAGAETFTFSNQAFSGWRNSFTVTKNPAIDDKIKGVELVFDSVIISEYVDGGGGGADRSGPGGAGSDSEGSRDSMGSKTGSTHDV
ncbi:MAG: hypothetical protein JEZ12_23580 [Desulfobacterium sp.]|nr:hypothetical protein [Desulfobacterium sp.]